MKKNDVVAALMKVRDAKGEWATAITNFNADIELMMHRLLREAARNYMSADEVARASGFTTKRIRILMRAAGLDPKRGKNLLASQAATALAENAALLGIEPSEMDLMSPLAYLPMGSEMKRELRANSVSQVDLDHIEVLDAFDRLADEILNTVPNVEAAQEDIDLVRKALVSGNDA